jgi:hypothetical protein
VNPVWLIFLDPLDIFYTIAGRNLSHRNGFQLAKGYHGTGKSKAQQP